MFTDWKVTRNIIEGVGELTYFQKVINFLRSYMWFLLCNLVTLFIGFKIAIGDLRNFVQVIRSISHFCLYFC